MVTSSTGLSPSIVLTEMYNTISSTIKNDVNIEIGGQCNIGVLTEAIESITSKPSVTLPKIVY